MSDESMMACLSFGLLFVVAELLSLSLWVGGSVVPGLPEVYLNVCTSCFGGGKGRCWFALAAGQVTFSSQPTSWAFPSCLPPPSPLLGGPLCFRYS